MKNLEIVITILIIIVAVSVFIYGMASLSKFTNKLDEKKSQETKDTFSECIERQNEWQWCYDQFIE